MDKSSSKILNQVKSIVFMQINKSILFVVNTLDVGGAAKMLKYVANICYKEFGTVEIVTIYNGKEYYRDLFPQIKVSSLNVKQSGITGRLKAICSLRVFLKKRNPDLVCSFISDIATTTRIATLGIHELIVVSAERGDPYTLPILWKKIVRWTYSHSDFCFFQLEKACKFFDVNVRRKSFIIPNPFIIQTDVNPFHGNRKKTIVSVGRFEFQKGYDVLIDAFYMVHLKHSDYKLILYGDGSLKSEYERQIRKLGLGDSVIMPGYIHNVCKTIREDGVFVLSSRFEGIPNSLIEAMSIGIPTISTDCTPGGPAFLTNDGERGLLVPVDDTSALSEAILFLIENVEVAKEYGKKGLNVLKELDEKKISKLWIDAFNSMLSKKKY